MPDGRFPRSRMNEDAFTDPLLTIRPTASNSSKERMVRVERMVLWSTIGFGVAWITLSDDRSFTEAFKSQLPMTSTGALRGH